MLNNLINVEQIQLYGYIKYVNTTFFVPVIFMQDFNQYF